MVSTVSIIMECMPRPHGEGALPQLHAWHIYATVDVNIRHAAVAMSLTSSEVETRL